MLYDIFVECMIAFATIVMGLQPLSGFLYSLIGVPQQTVELLCWSLLFIGAPVELAVFRELIIFPLFKIGILFIVFITFVLSNSYIIYKLYSSHANKSEVQL